MDSDEDKKSKSSTGKRKFHQKSRNGCSTCKKRRVKCDENKPSCNKCVHMKLACGYLTDVRSDEEEEELPAKKKKVKSSPTLSSSEMSALSSDVSLHSPDTLATPALTPSPGLKDLKAELKYPDLTGSADSILGDSFDPASISSLLNAGNLNNINISQLVNNLSGMGTDLSLLGNLASLSNLASLANLPIDLSSISSLLQAPNMSGLSSLLPNLTNGAPAQKAPKQAFNAQGDSSGEARNSTYSEGARNSTYSEGASNSPYSGGASNSPYSGDATNSGDFNTERNNSGEPGFSGEPNVSPSITDSMNSSGLNMLDLRLMFHYTSQVSNTITGAGISDTNIWNYDIPMLAFDHPFLMHSILAFSATHLSRTEKGLDQCVTSHRGDALRLLREAVLNINADNTDALVASALILIMDSLANASFPSSTSPKSLPALAWIFHVKGAATILTAVWPLTESSRFYKFISVDLGDIGEIINQKVHITKDGTGDNRYFTDLECHDSDIADLFPVEIYSPYLITLAYLNKLHKERYKSDFILRIFAFPALLDKSFLSLLMMGDIKAMRIMRSYYKLLRSFTTELKDKVWFLEGVSLVLPVDVEEYAGGAGGMTMMLDFLGGGPSLVENELAEEISKFDPQGLLASKLDTDNLPSDITLNLEVMRGDYLGENAANNEAR